MSEDRISCWADRMSAGEVGQGHQKVIHKGRDRYGITDRRYRYDSYANGSNDSYNDQLTASQWMEAKLFLDKIWYFDGSNNKEALNYLAQCEEAAEKMKAP